MYLSAAMAPDRKTVQVWERSERGRVLKRYPTPYYFYVPSEVGQFKDIHGKKLNKLSFATWNEFNSAREKYRNRGDFVYESDIRAEYKVLSEHYLNAELPKTHITFFDIEVDYEKSQGHSTIENPYAPISAIAIHHYWSNQDIVLVVPPKNRAGISVEEVGIAAEYPDVKLEIFENEKQLLIRFFELIEDSDILSGWNSSTYDVPYIYERTKIVLSEAYANRLCFDGAKTPKYFEEENKTTKLTRKYLEIYGRESVDYLQIFKKFEVVDRRSFKLETISEELFPELKKLDYDGSLYDLYREDFTHFVRYNIRDCEILKAMEDRLGYVQLAIQFANTSTGLLKDVTGTTKLAEMAIMNFCHESRKAILPDSRYSESSGEKFTGALVLPPQVGMHEMVGAVDVASLYPSAIRALNASPETIVGQFFDNHVAYEEIMKKSDVNLFFKFENGDIEEKTAAQWNEYLIDSIYSISAYGSVFDLKKEGFIPAILTDWFKQRKFYKKNMSIAKDAMRLHTEGSPEYIKHKHEYDNANRLQYIFKIRLNSLYGALGNQFFKFYDIRLAESTTRTGREILMHMVRKVAELLDGEYTYPSESTIYSDTDSCYFLTHAKDIDQAIEVGKAVEHKVNASFPEFCSKAFLCTNEFNSLISAELDVIASRSIFIKKKYYIMQVDWAEGAKVDKLKVMGVHLKKTTIPKPVSIVLSNVVQDLLKGHGWVDISTRIVDYRDHLMDNGSIVEIGHPKTVKTGLLEATKEYKDGNLKVRMSGGVSASVFYNLCLEQYGDTESDKILPGSKIRTFYLRRKIGRFKSIALPTDLRAVPTWFTEHFVELIDRERQAVNLVVNPLKIILEAIDKNVPTRQSMLFDELVEY